jgi:hypothetical protein
VTRARRPEDLTAAEQAVREASLLHTGSKVAVIDVRDVVACGVSPATFARVRALAEQALANRTAVTTLVSQAHPAVIAHHLVFPVLLSAPAIASLQPDRAPSWAGRAMSWLLIAATTRDRALARRIVESLKDSGEGFCDLWDGLLGDKAVLAVAAGLSIEEAVDAEVAGALNSSLLQGMAALRGYPATV